MENSEEFYSAKNYEAALLVLQESLKTKSADDSNAQSRAAECLFHLNRFEEAIAIYSNLSLSSAKQFSTYIQCMESAKMSLVQIEKAVDDSVGYSISETCSLDLALFLGAHYVERITTHTTWEDEDDEDRCVRLVRESIDRIEEIAMNSIEGLIIKGRYFSYLNQHKEAMSMFNKFIQAKPDDFRGYFYLAASFYAQHKYAEAIQWYLASDEHRKGEDDSSSNDSPKQQHGSLDATLNVAVNQAKPEWVLDIYAKKMKIDPKSSIVYRSVIIALMKLGKNPAAVMIGQNWVSDHPENQEAWQILAELSFKANNFAVAEEAYKKLCALTEEKNPLFCNMVAAILITKKLEEEALQFCIKAILAQPAYALAWRNLAEIRKISKDNQEIARFIQEFAKNNEPNQAVVEFVRTIASTQSKEEAITYQDAFKK